MSDLQKVVIITELKILTPVKEEFCLLLAKLKILRVLFFRAPCRYQSAKTL